MTKTHIVVNFVSPFHTYRYTYRLVVALAMVLSATCALAQNGGGKSSYSRFGLGLLNDPAQTWNKAMGGVGVALPSGGKLNTLNPASYAHLDSLTFILDVGMSGNFGQMTMGGNRKNVNNANFDHLMVGFRLRKNLGLSFGFRQYSTVDYNYMISSPNAFRDEITGELVRSTTNYAGNGGLNHIFAGLGWKPFGNFSIGANVGILWGSYEHMMSQSFMVDGSSSSSFDGFNFLQSADIITYKLDLGVQYAFRVSPMDWLTVGATVGIGHQFDGDAKIQRYMTTGEPLTVNAEDNAFDLPMTYAGGIAWQHKNNLIVSADAHYQMWGKCRMPVADIANGVVSYPTSNKVYKNNYMLKAGMEYTPDPFATKKYLKRVKYRLGVSYSTPYMNISTGSGSQVTSETGPSELAVTAGLGLPINTQWGRGSTVNVGLQWLRRDPSSINLIKENYFVLNLGITFNENWFMKYKIR